MIQFGTYFSRQLGLATGALDFDRARRWFNQTYGHSQEAHLQESIDIQTNQQGEPAESNPLWAYHVEYRDFRIYTNEPEVVWFQLTFTKQS